MQIERRFTTTDTEAYGALAFKRTSSEIRNPDGSVVFSLKDIEVPESWSQVASDVLAQKYFRKAGVPAALKKVREKGVPSFLWRSVPDEAKLAKLPEAERSVGETTARQVFDRLAGAWAYWGWKGGYFSSEADAKAYYDEMRYMLASQMGAPNSPAMVQHRAALGLRHRRSGAGALLRRFRDRGADEVDLRLRASAAPCLLHPVGLRRSGERWRHHGSLDPRGAALQVRLGHGDQLLEPALGQ